MTSDRPMIAALCALSLLAAPGAAALAAGASAICAPPDRPGVPEWVKSRRTGVTDGMPAWVAERREAAWRGLPEWVRERRSLKRAGEHRGSTRARAPVPGWVAERRALRERMRALPLRPVRPTPGAYYGFANPAGATGYLVGGELVDRSGTPHGGYFRYRYSRHWGPPYPPGFGRVPPPPAASQAPPGPAQTDEPAGYARTM